MESGNGTFALNLTEFRDEYKNPIAYLDQRTRSTLGTGSIVCFGIVALMILANYIVTLMGWDVDTKIKSMSKLSRTFGDKAKEED